MLAKYDDVQVRELATWLLVFSHVLQYAFKEVGEHNSPVSGGS